MTISPRREFLLRILAACGTPLLAPTPSLHANQTSASGQDVARGVRAANGYFGKAAGDAALTIGEAYLRHLGVERNAASITEVARGALDVIIQTRTQPAAITALVAAVRRDFQEGKTVQLEGWLVSRTEAEICVLTLLTQDRATAAQD